MTDLRSRFKSVSVDVLMQMELENLPAHTFPTSPTECASCGAVYCEGRWGVAPGHVREGRCPACERIAQHLPAAWIVLTAEFSEHQDNALRLIEEGAERARALHPLRRLIGREVGAEGLELSFTDMRLARELADIVQHAFHAQLTYYYDAEAR
jgi:NMD protein affecting ribosome stability and mRNA decay